MSVDIVISNVFNLNKFFFFCCLLLIEFHCNFSISYKILQYYVYYHLF